MPDPELQILAQVEQRLVAVMHRDHPLAAKGSGVRLRDCAAWPLALSDRDTAGRQMLERYLARSSLGLRPVIESNSFEMLRNCVLHDGAITFQIAIGAPSGDGPLVVRDIEDRGFPRGELVLAHLAGRQLPVIAHAFSEHLVGALAAG